MLGDGCGEQRAGDEAGAGNRISGLFFAECSQVASVYLNSLFADVLDDLRRAFIMHEFVQ